MDNIDRDLTIEFARVAKGKFSECECEGTNCHCDGAYKYDANRSRCYHEGNNPCPSCAKLRKLAELCWHECDSICEIAWVNSGKKCKIVNPTYTIPQVKDMLEVLGEWEGFWKWLWVKCWNDYGYGTTSIGHGVGVLKARAEFVRILTTPELFKDACISYLRGIE